MRRILARSCLVAIAFMATTGAAQARFMQVDPIGYKDNVNLYAYVGDDPMDHVDYTGTEIDDPNKSTRVQVAPYINTISKRQYTFDSNGHLVASGAADNKNGSSYYSKRLDTAISGKSVIDINISQTATTPGGTGALKGMLTYQIKVDESAGGGVPTYGGHQVTITGHSSNDNGVKSNPAQILAHELAGHAIPLLFGGGTGNAIKDENIIRQQTGAPLRPADPIHTECYC